MDMQGISGAESTCAKGGATAPDAASQADANKFSSAMAGESSKAGGCGPGCSCSGCSGGGTEASSGKAGSSAGGSAEASSGEAGAEAGGQEDMMAKILPLLQQLMEALGVNSEGSEAGAAGAAGGSGGAANGGKY